MTTTLIAHHSPPPTMVCPPWCLVPQEQHVADLPSWEGMVIHHSAVNHGVHHSRMAYIDNTPDPDDEPLVFLGAVGMDGLALDKAEALAQAILAAVKEAGS